MGVSGGWGLQDPPLRAVGHGLGHWGGTGGQLWGQWGRVGSQEVTGGQGCIGVNGGWGQMGLQDPPLQAAGHGLGHWGAHGVSCGVSGVVWGHRGS